MTSTTDDLANSESAESDTTLASPLNIPRTGRMIGIDWGAARIGLSVSDSTQTLASPHSTLHDKDKGRQITHVVALAQELEAVGFVVGLPLDAAGDIGPVARSTNMYSEKLGRVSGLPVARIDERYSSVEAAEKMRESGTYKQRRGESLHVWKGRLDAAAATLLMQEWLDQRSDG